VHGVIPLQVQDLALAQKTWALSFQEDSKAILLGKLPAEREY